MKRRKPLTCAKCGQKATERPAIIEHGQLVKPITTTATFEVMRCPDCDGGDGYASMCRDCCPTGHRTRFNTTEGWQ